MHRFRFATPLLLLTLAATAHAQGTTAAGPNPNMKFGMALTGINSLNTASIVYSGLGTAIVPGGKKGLQPLTVFRVAINYGMESLRVDLEQPGKPARVSQMLAEGKAWDVIDKKIVARPDAVRERLRLMLMTPHGIMKAAQDAGNKRVMANEKIGNAIITTMVIPMEGFTLKAYLDDKAMITRVHTVGGGPLGKSVVEFLYSDYKDVDTIAPPTGPKPGGAAAAAIYGGIPFPTHIVQLVDGEPILDVKLTEVTPNAGLSLDVPDPVVARWPKKH